MLATHILHIPQKKGENSDIIQRNPKYVLQKTFLQCYPLGETGNGVGVENWRRVGREGRRRQNKRSGGAAGEREGRNKIGRKVAKKLHGLNNWEMM